MSRRAFLAIAWRPQAEAADLAARKVAELDRDPAWTLAADAPGHSLWVEAKAPLPATRWGDIWIVGETFPHPDAPTPWPQRQASGGFDALVGAVWGSYVAFRPCPDGGLEVLRDPSGMLDALVWTLGPGLTGIASDPTRVPAGFGPRRPFLNWDRIGRMLAHPAAMTTDPLVDDVHAVPPGACLDLDTLAVRPVWSPTAFARTPAADIVAAQQAVVARVDQCAAALVGAHDGVLMELSGGLDSSLLAASLAAAGLDDRVRQWLNLQDARPEADETRYAADVTARLGVPLTTVPWRPGAITAEDLAELAPEFWPAMAGVDAARDRDMVARLRATGASGIVSGQGGDAAFLQIPSSLIAADALRAGGLVRLLGAPLLPAVARRTRRSVWQVLAEALAAERGGPPARDFASSLISRELRATAHGLAHPWEHEARSAGLPHGKQLHIQAMSRLHVNHGCSRRRQADLLYPLAAQPVLELCLSLPTPWLAGATYDRPFARDAFAHRLPASVRDRRAKGETTTHFQKLVAHSLPVLRPYLLDGCLADAGLLDRGALDHALDPAGLIWDAPAAQVMWAASLEAWVRHWQTRVPDSAAARWRR